MNKLSFEIYVSISQMSNLGLNYVGVLSAGWVDDIVLLAMLLWTRFRMCDALLGEFDNITGFNHGSRSVHSVVFCS